MSLPDPLILTHSDTITYSGTQRDFSYAKQSDGKYICTTMGTADEPYLCSISNDYRPGGTSTITMRLSRAKNVTINGIPQADDVLGVSMQIKIPNRSFTANDAYYLLRQFAYIAHNTTVLTQLIRGEK